MPKTLSRWLPLAIVTVAALWLRTRGLALRPMHADEANQAVRAGELLETGRYAYDPRDHHGPLLYYGVLPVAWCRGQGTLAGLDEVTVRLVPALAGTACVLLLGLLAAPLGRWPSLAAAAFLAASPPAVYYSRYFIQETLLAASALAAFVCARQWLREGRARWAGAAGACLGLMLASKESAPLFALAAFAAFLLARAAGGPPLPGRPARGLLAGAAAAIAVTALFYSSFGAHPSGLRDLLGGYGQALARLRGANTGHEKPWWYFLRLFTWWRAGGLVFEEAGFAALVLAGFCAALARGTPLLRWAAAYSGLVLIALSAVPYKTPWHAVDLAPGFALLAAGAVAAPSRTRPGRWAASAAALAVLGMLAFQADRSARAYASDPRNPFAYVHSSPDVLRFRPMAEAALGRSPDGVIRVISEEYWPLPWYFRGLARVGYWDRPPADCDGALVIASADLAGAVRSRLRGAYAESYLGLRPGFVCVVFTPRP